MKLLWTKSHFFPVDPICWGLNEPCGHFAIEFFDSCVYHSFAFGPECVGVPDFFKKRELVFSIKIPIDPVQEIEIFKRMIQNTDLKYYDYKYFLWLFERGFLFKFFGRPIDGGRLVENKNEFICHEIIQGLDGMVEINYDRLSAITPYRLFKDIRLRNSLSKISENHFELIKKP